MPNTTPDKDPSIQQTTTDLRQVFSLHYTVSKRQLGIALTLIGILGFLGILAIDLVGQGRESGIGPAQAIALVFMALVTVFGLSLIPLGDRPA